MTYFLDTDICVDALRDRLPGIKRKLKMLEPRQVKIPSMVQAELLFGALRIADPVKREEVNKFLSPFDIVPFGPEAALAYAKIRHDMQVKGTPIGPADLIIAATATAHHATLVTHNTKEFSRISGLLIEDWTE